MITRTTILTAILLTGSLHLTACEKGPKTKAEAPAAKATEQQAAPADQATPAKQDETPAEGKTYGDGVSEMSVVSISDLVADPHAFEGKTVRVEGIVTDVCQKRGCWMELAGDAPGKKLRFKVQDGVMVFPMTEKGKYAVAEGTIALQELSVEDARAYAAHKAEEKGEEFDPNTITEPTTVVRLDGTGAIIRDKQ